MPGSVVFPQLCCLTFLSHNWRINLGLCIRAGVCSKTLPTNIEEQFPLSDSLACTLDGSHAVELAELHQFPGRRSSRDCKKFSLEAAMN